MGPETDNEEETEQEVVFVTLKATSVIKISAIEGKPDKGCYVRAAGQKVRIPAK